MAEDLVLDSTMIEERRTWMNLTLNTTLFSRRITPAMLGKIKSFFLKLTKLTPHSYFSVFFNN